MIGTVVDAWAFKVLVFGRARSDTLKRITGEKFTTTLDGPVIHTACFVGKTRSLTAHRISNPLPGYVAGVFNEVETNEYAADIIARTAGFLYIVNVVNNVDLVRVAPARKVPKYQRKYPKLEYRVLKLRDRKAKGAVSPKLAEQLRASPRQHLRRGGPVTLRSDRFKHMKGQTIWLVLVSEPGPGWRNWYRRTTILQNTGGKSA